MADTVGEVVRGWLIEGGYEGLYNKDFDENTHCSCLLCDLFARCEGSSQHCRPGYVQKSWVEHNRQGHFRIGPEMNGRVNNERIVGGPEHGDGR